MRLSQYFLPTLKETPAEAKVASHVLMLRAGMIHQTAAGIYSWLPMGTRVLKKIEQIVREEQDALCAHEMLLPTIQPADLWRESERYEAYGKEMLRIVDRHDRDMLYGPTAEEVITDVARSHFQSYRDLPQILYQIHWKFRDEIRPRFGVMRGREFFMKDAYSFDASFEDAQKTYYRMYEAYLRTFARMGLAAIGVRAETGPIGGDLSHEFQVLAQTGESEIFYDKRMDDLRDQDTIDVKAMAGLYAASDELHDPSQCPVPEKDLRSTRGIEIGHIFYLGTKYSEIMGLSVPGKDGKPITPHMGCFGIGVSRLVGAVIEASHDENGIIWPEAVAPFKVGILNMRVDDIECSKACESVYNTLKEKGIEVLYDDRDVRAGVKFSTMDLIGLPWQLTIGPKGLKNGVVELKKRATGEKEELSLESALARLS
ncbi:MAG: proline--tRNA ligase [bacterium]|nr:proline--tRNA ligase [bacterium]